uniref:CW-type domain-containing protein n=1 Tax=Aegilops tauschii subsp. strangulata TaxID=200361 RepID=A0A453T1S6_AEGTS
CSSDDYFVEPAELDATEMPNLSLSLRREDKKTSIGNWIQCQEVLDTGAICGKWRRAPLFVVQSSDWDCSCSVLWDPIRADCAVPQLFNLLDVLSMCKYISL